MKKTHVKMAEPAAEEEELEVVVAAGQDVSLLIADNLETIAMLRAGIFSPLHCVAVL